MGRHDANAWLNPMGIRIGFRLEPSHEARTAGGGPSADRRRASNDGGILDARCPIPKSKLMVRARRNGIYGTIWIDARTSRITVFPKTCTKGGRTTIRICS